MSSELIARAYEVVCHDDGCPAIGGAGDEDCRCDAVPFLRDLEKAFLDYQPTDQERAVIADIGRQQELSNGAIMRQALRLYQLDFERRKAGEICAWSGDAQRLRDFAGDSPSPRPDER